MKKGLSIFLLAAVFGLAACAAKDKTVAKIGSEKISTAMLAERLTEAPPAYQNYLNTLAGKKQFLDLLVRERVVVESARRSGVDRLADYKKAVTDFKKDQARRLKDYEESLLMELYIKDLHAKQIGASDAEIDRYYTDHEKEFLRPREITARHILVPTQEEADKVVARLKAGEDFAALAREVSTDPISASRGGEIGPFRRGDLVPEFESAVFGLKIGQLSGIVKTQFGYHIIKKTAEKALPPRSVEDSKLEIKKILEKTKFDAWLEKAKNTCGVSVDYDMLSKIQPAAPPEAGDIGKTPTGTGPETDSGQPGK